MPVGCENTNTYSNYASRQQLCGLCYLKARMAQTLQSVYLENEGQPLQVCEGLLKGEDIVAEAMGLPVKECDLTNDNCESGLRCVVNGGGTRCVEAAGTDLGPLVEELGGDGTRRAGDEKKEPGHIYTEVGLGESCSTSRECPTGASCLGVLSGKPQCTKHCLIRTDCGEGYVCHGRRRCYARSLASRKESRLRLMVIYAFRLLKGALSPSWMAKRS